MEGKCSKKNLDALVTSCVVFPFSFTHPHENLPTSRLGGIWHRSNKRNEKIYYEDNTKVLDNFRARTQLLGQLGQNNCTLEIIEIKDHDNGPFCFRIELAQTETDAFTTDKFSFVNDTNQNCFKSMPTFYLNNYCLIPNLCFLFIADPPKSTVTSSKIAIQDHPYTVTCSVTHTCPSHWPKLTWSRGTANEVTEVHRQLPVGYWETLSILIVIPEVKNDHSEVTCTAKFNGGKTSSTILTLFVKREKETLHSVVTFSLF